MKLSLIRKSLVVMGASALIATGTVVVIPSASAAPVCSDAAGITTCLGKLTAGGDYVIKVPANFGGTVFFWNHGFRNSYTIPGVTTAPTTVQEITPVNDTTLKDVTGVMLRKGYGVASYDGASNGLHGWNNDDRIEMLKELIDITGAKFTTMKKKVVYGSSQAGSFLPAFAEKYPAYADAVGIMAGLEPAKTTIASLCDTMYILSVFADPTIKGCAALGVKDSAGGQTVAVGEILKVAALLTAWSKNLGAPALAYPAAIAPYGIPQRSALLMMGLLTGIPTKSAHMDGITTNSVILEQSINSTVAVLENASVSIVTGVLAGQAISQLTGPGFYDNTKTDYASLLTDAELGRYNLGLSGDDGINIMLGALAAAPRVKGNAEAMAKFAALDKTSYSSTKPFVMMSNEADRLVFAGNQALYVEKARANYEARLAKYEDALAAATTLAQKKAARASKPVWNVLSLYAVTPDQYTTYTEAGLPNLSAAPSPSGVGHQTFTVAQMTEWVRQLANAAKSGKVAPQSSVPRLAQYAAGLSDDPDFLPNELKYK